MEGRRSHYVICPQVYNYHRLLSWNKERGLHMDIYKVPTCCSCHIMGYSYVYPPLKGLGHGGGGGNKDGFAGGFTDFGDGGFSGPPSGTTLNGCILNRV